MHRRRRLESPSFAGFRFPPEVILLAVRWYLRYGLSYRDIEELLAERGVEVDRVIIYRWVQLAAAIRQVQASTASCRVSDHRTQQCQSRTR